MFSVRLMCVVDLRPGTGSQCHRNILPRRNTVVSEWVSPHGGLGAMSGQVRFRGHRERRGPNPLLVRLQEPSERVTSMLCFLHFCW